MQLFAANLRPLLEIGIEHFAITTIARERIRIGGTRRMSSGESAARARNVSVLLAADMGVPIVTRFYRLAA